MRRGKIKLAGLPESLADEIAFYIRLDVMTAMGKRDIHANLMEKWALLKRIKDCTIDGKLYVEQSGMDCDGVKYWGDLHTCEPDLLSFYRLHEDVSSWVDGPYSLHILSKKELEELRPGSVDLGSQAHEDGHPHVIYC